MKLTEACAAFLLLVIFAVPIAAKAQDITELGGELTSRLEGRHAIQLPAPNVTSRERFELQLSGFPVFHKIFSAKEGLGPEFVHKACGSCHVNNGRGRVSLLPAIQGGSSMVIKVSLRGLSDNGAPRDVPGVGEQLQEHSINGKRRFDARLRWKLIRGKYPDGTGFTLRKPDLNFQVPRFTRRKLAHSLRMTPHVIGPGLLEAIPEETILSFSDPDDLDGDGISGRPQIVPDLRSGKFKIGRFGFKSSHTTVEQQSAAAAFNDMGITNALFPGKDGSSELNDQDLRSLVVYLQIAGVPAARNQDDPRVIQGRSLFQQIGCESCHRTSILTGASEAEEVVGQLIHPFTDLLLHDMGSGLADRRAEYSARGSEWRTTPLWGLGHSATISRVRPRLLHDGRARTIEEAILWHGGEAETSKNNFKSLSKEERGALIAFLRSL